MYRFLRYKDFTRFHEIPPEKFSEEQKIVVENVLKFFSQVKYDRTLVRSVGYFLLKSSLGFDTKTVSRLTKYSYSQMREINKLSAYEYINKYEQKFLSPGRACSIPPELLGEIHQWMLKNRCNSSSKIADYLCEKHDIEVCEVTVSRFLKKYGISKSKLDSTNKEQFVGKTNFLGGWLLFPLILPLIEQLLPIFGEKAKSFCGVFLTIFFSSLFGIPRMFHLADINDSGFALLTSRRTVMSRSYIYSWLKSCPKSLLEAFYHKSRTVGVDLPQDQELKVSIDEHVIVRWTKKFDMAGTLWPTRGKSGKADKIFYVYALAKRLLLSCLPLPANKKLSYCMVQLIKDLRKTYGIHRVRAILDAGGCKGFPIAKLLRMSGVTFIVKGYRWAKLVESWENLPRSIFKKRVDPADAYKRKLYQPKRFLYVANTATKIKGCKKLLRTILIYYPKEKILKDRYIAIFTNDETSDCIDIIREYRSRQSHEMVYRDMKYHLSLDQIPPSTSPGQNPENRRFYPKPLLFFGWIKALVFNTVQNFQRTFRGPIAKMRVGTLVRKYFARSGSIYKTQQNLILQFDYFKGQDSLISYCEKINAMRLAVPWLDDRKILFRFTLHKTKSKVTQDWCQSFL